MKKLIQIIFHLHHPDVKKRFINPITLKIIVSLF